MCFRSKVTGLVIISSTKRTKDDCMVAVIHAYCGCLGNQLLSRNVGSKYGQGASGVTEGGAGLHPSPKMEIKPIENVTVQETDQSHRLTQTELFVLQL